MPKELLHEIQKQTCTSIYHFITYIHPKHTRNEYTLYIMVAEDLLVV